jgi:vacuolar-type H+-ATPase subunit E/Vma4
MLTGVLDQHEDEAKKQSEMRIKAEKINARQQQNMAVSRAQLELKREYGLRRKELKKKLFEEVEEKVQKFMETPEYVQLLIAYIDKAARFAEGEELTIYINPTDADKKEYLEEHTGMQLTISKEDFVGGVRAVVHGRNVLIDHAYKGAIEQEFQSFVFRGGAGIGE